MMKKKVKKIPKYSFGTIGAKNTDLSIKSNPAGEAYHAQMRRKFLGSGGAGRPLNGGGAAAGEEGSGISMPGGIATASNEILTNALGIEDNSQAGVTLNSAAQGADIGGSIVPGWGHLIGGVAGGLIGSFKKGSVDEFGNITYGGIFGRSKSSLQREANVKKNSIAAVTHTQNLQADYYNNPNVTLQPTTAAEGGIMRQPVDALVSKGELIYNPMTKKLSKVPGSKGKPNKADDVYARLYEGDVVISNSPTMLMANGKTPAQNLEGLVDKYATGGTVKAREAIIKKVVNWQEANKTEPQEYAKYSLGEDEVLDVKIEPVKVAGKKPKVGKDGYLKLGKDLVDDEQLFKPIKAEITGNDPLKNLTEEQRRVLREAIMIQNGKSKANWLNVLSDYAPLASALFGDYDYHREQPYINPAKYIPTGVSIEPIRRAANESYAMARYNQANISPNTGAGMAYGLQAASNRAKTLADAYTWQQDAQNKLIAQNVGIYNDWAAREAQARHIANTETRQNEAAADYMRKTDIKSGLDWYQGKRRDRQILPALKQYLGSGMYQSTLDNLNV